MINLVATGSYVPERRCSFDQLVARDIVQNPVRSWTPSYLYLSDFMRAYGYDETALVAAAEASDPARLREHAGHDHAAVEDSLSVADMCVAASRGVLAQSERAALRAIMTCQSSMDAEYNTNSSTVLRLQCEYNFKDLAFAVADNDGANIFVALSLLEHLYSDAEASSGKTSQHLVLLCCGERWRQPFPRVLGAHTLLGDAAGCLLFSSDRTSDWRLRGVHTATLADGWHPWTLATAAEPPPISQAAVSHQLTTFLRGHDLAVTEIGRVIPPHVNRDFARRVHERVGFSNQQLEGEGFGHHGYLCSADACVRLHETLRRDDARGLRSILLWGMSWSGLFGCALFTRSSS